MAGYKYRRLSGSGCIRTAIVQAGNFDDDIVISLRPAQFSEEEVPWYEALSYVWGSAEHPTPIYVATPNEPQTTLLVTQNLGVALRYLRLADQTRVMWIDAICIDQTNNEEKGLQVALMGEIYRRATRVVAWLGPQENESDRAMECMLRLGSQIDVDWGSYEMRPSAPSTDPTVADANVNLPWDARELTAVYRLLCRRWFERLWIRQEVFLANSQAIIKCGSREVLWTIFRAALLAAFQKPSVSFELEDDLFNRQMFLRGFIHHSEPTLRLLQLRGLYENAFCADPRDRVYGVLAMLHDEEKAFGITPDYSRSMMGLYRDVVTRWLRYYASLDIILQCEFDEGRRPSWVPDWSTPLHSRTPSQSFASSQLLAWLEVVEQGVLRAAGVSTSRITHVQPLGSLIQNSILDTFSKLRTVLTKEGLHGLQPQPEGVLDAYCIALLCGRDSDSQHPPRADWPTKEEAKEVMNWLVSDTYGYFSGDFLPGTAGYKFLTAAASRMHGNVLMKTSKGHIGLGPPSAQPGDEVCVLMGCDSPVALRAVDNSRFVLVGTCYVHDISDGKALLGPLPDSTRGVAVLHKDAGVYSRAILDEESGEILFADPRLGRMGVDLAEFRNALESDPFKRINLSPDVLLEHGVNVVCFDIV